MLYLDLLPHKACFVTANVLCFSSIPEQEGGMGKQKHGASADIYMQMLVFQLPSINLELIITLCYRLIRNKSIGQNEIL